MSMRIIRGAIGSGKVGLCLDEIEKTHNENPKNRCIMIVPNHYSYETERQFVERFGGTGLNNIEALTLRKMAINCLSAADLRYLTPSGKQMLIYRAVRDYGEKTDITDVGLLSAVKKPGFLDVAASLISEMKRYAITPQTLIESTGKIENNDTLKNKLEALGSIYSAYNGFIASSGYTDSEDDIDRLASYIEGSGEFGESVYVWFAKFDEFMPHQLRVIEAFLKRGANVTVCVNFPRGEDGAYAELSGNFYRLCDMADAYGGYEEICLDGALKHMKKNRELKFLFETWNDNHASFDGDCARASLFEARDMYSEVEYAAGRILDLVREDGMRFSDIAVLCGDAQEYSHIAETVFSDYAIPYFTDSTIALPDHPAALQLLSLFDILEEDWSYESVFAYLRAGFIYDENGTPLSQNEIDRLENFVLRCGIRGQSKWLSDTPWGKDEDIISTAFGTETHDFSDGALDDLRRKITAPIVAFKEATSRRKTARAHATALFEYLTEINLYKGLKREIAKLRDEGLLNEAEQFTSIWNLLLEVLNQAVVTVGDEVMNRAEFSEYIRAGLSKCEIRTIPSGIDQVYLGSVERSSRTRVRAMFIIGAVSGTFPDEFGSEGFLSNNDRNTLLEQYDITLAPDTKKKMEKQYFKVYRAMCAVTDALFLSYPVQSSEGRALRPSRMLSDISKKLPNMEIKSNLSVGDEKIYISSPKATIHKMLINKSCGKANPVWDAAYEWYKKSGEWDNMLKMLNRAEDFSARDIRIDAGLALELYRDKGAYSASRLNAYAQCPFGYFIRYGLGAYERRKWEITPADVGSYAHAVIREFCETVEEGASCAEEKLEKWRCLREDGEEGSSRSREEILDAIIDRTQENMLSSQSRDKERAANIFGRMGKTIRHAAKIVHMSFRNGQYAEEGMERHFELDLGGGIAIKGDIDRLDVYNEAGGDARVRIIDYKTGHTSFDVVDICNRIDMQPVIYAIAARELVREELEKPAAVTGIYYNKVRDDFEKLTYSGDAARAEEKHARSRKLDGVTFIDNVGDNRVIYDMDSALENGAESVFLNIPLDDSGAIAQTDNVKCRAQIEGLMDTVRDNIEKMDSEIKSGKISLEPYYASQDVNACKYCAYKGVCSFDDDKREERVREGNKAELWDMMNEKGGGV